jgi:tRNA-2-methylthio-N6-dimethylallyladenosine synthase
MEKIGFNVHQDEQSMPDLLIVNTCSVRQKSEDKAYGFMVNVKKKFPKTILVVTGCMVRQTGNRKNSKDKLLQHDIIDFVFRIEDTDKLSKLLEPNFPGHNFTSFGGGSLASYFQINPKVDNRFQVFVPIMQGCDKFCAFCIVPYTRGREISREIYEVVTECEKLVANGAKEITLLGQNVNSYRDGKDGEKCFAKLLLEIDKLHSKGLSRLRFTSPHPQDFTDDVIDALAKMKTSCPYIHLPLQHGSDSMLKKMARNYDTARFVEIVDKIRAKIPNITLATDIIVGFPGETEEEFMELCEFAKKIKFDFSYTAIYSPRENTPAAKLEKEFIPVRIKKDRFKAFDDIIKEIAWKKRAEIVGRNLEVLVEKSTQQDDGKFLNMGRSREFFEVWFSSSKPQLNEEVKVKITESHGYVLHGEMTEKEEIITDLKVL